MTIPPEDYPESFPYYSIFADCIAYWDFKDGSLYDVIGNKHLSVKGSPVLTNDHFGYANNAYDLNGNSYFYNSISASNEITLVAVIYPTSVNTNGGGLITKSDLNSNYGDFDLHIYNENLTITINSNSYHIAQPITINQWSICIGTYDGHTLKLYNNGILLDSLVCDTALTNTYSTLCIGSYYLNTTEFDGKMSNAMIYNKALSDSEVKQLTELLQKRYIYPTQQAEMQE